MFLPFGTSEFLDKYSDHIVFATSSGTGGVLAEVWRVIPLEVAIALTAALFIALRVCLESYLHKRHAAKVRRRLRTHHRVRKTRTNHRWL